MGLTARRIAAAGVTVTALAMVALTPASAAYARPALSIPHGCAPAGLALNFSDSLDKLTFDGTQVGGLSSLAFDRSSGSWMSSVDNHGTDPARLWSFRNLAHPAVTRDPLVLKRADGTPYDGTNSDNEGLAVLPDGDYVVSSETEPSIRIFGRDGVQKASLPVPARFGVTGATAQGEATSNATLEGLTITPDGHEIIAAMEGSLSGDISSTGDSTLHRFLVYDVDKHGTWTLTKQIAYRTEAGNRVPEVAAYGHGNLLVEEAAFTATAGNSVELYAVTGLDHAADVSAVSNLSTAPAKDVVAKRLVANLVDCPSLGAPSRETQANPLLDNYEGMAITFGGTGLAGVSLISDDNFSATQFTRVLNLLVVLP